MTPASWLLAGLAFVALPSEADTRRRMSALATRARSDQVVPEPRSTVARPPAAVLAAAVVITAGATVALLGAALGLTIAVATATGVRLGLRAVHARTRRRRELALLSAVRLIVAEVAAGAGASAALTAAGDVAVHRRGEFVAAARQCERGEAPDFAAADLATLGHAWRMSSLTGAPVAATLTRVADDLAAHIEHRRSVAIAASGAQASALMLAALPALGVTLGVAMGAQPVHVLFATPAGRVLTLLGVSLDCAGVLWTARLTTRAVRE